MYDTRRAGSGRPATPNRGPIGTVVTTRDERTTSGPGRRVRFAMIKSLLVAVGLLITVAGIVFTAFALLAAFLNAAFDFCLGCQVYLFIQRNLRVRPSA